ncbi:hypothetical protein RLOC_00007515 [Lonchura striata]|uniref:MAM domain-containing protein n=1 Tax=Lonchura striata TaxID=40157 RepID=A0A218UQB9_9PASE|nr:hypothetical protein RLOC_00007515 [Lonchura striata domestica]
MGPPYFDHNGNESDEVYPLYLSYGQINPAFPSVMHTIRFHYWVSQRSKTLMVGLQKLSEDTVTNIWQVSGELRNQWNINTITINSTERFEDCNWSVALYTTAENVIFSGMVETQGQGESVAIDDITFSEGCSVAHVPQTSIFELGMCEWHSDQPAEPALGARLQTGHKIASCSFQEDSSKDTEGHFEWLETNDKALYERAHLNSSMCHCSSKTCHFQFHYSMADSSVLKAVLLMNQEEHLLWETSILTKKEFVKVNIQLPIGLENTKHE